MVEIINHNSWNDIQNYERPPAIIKTAESLWISPKTWNLVFDTKNWVATILIKGETKKETNELNENFKKEFIEVLKNKTKNQNILDSIEKWTLKIFNIPWKDKFAISLNGINVDYVFNKDWTQYFELFNRRQNNIKYAVFQWILKDLWLEEVLTNWIYILKKDWKKLNNFSNEYLLSLMLAIDKSLEYANILRNLKDKK